MKLKESFTPKAVYRLAVGVSFVLVALAAIVFYIQMDSLSKSARHIAKSGKAQFELEKIAHEIIRYENNIRSYIITNDSAFIKANSSIKSDVFKGLGTIRYNLLYDHENIKDADGLSRLIKERFAMFEETQQALRTANPDPTAIYKKLISGSEKTKTIHSKIYKIIDREAGRLKTHNISHRYDVEYSIITAFALAVFVLVILIFSLNKINRDFQKTKKLNEELNFVNQISDNAEKVAGISHWKINVSTGGYFYSDNFYRIMGVDKASFGNRLEDYKALIHPDDLEEAFNAHQQSLESLTPTSLIYRIVRPSGEIRYISSTGDFTTNSKGELVKIGVTNDVTDEHNSKLALEEKNRSLTLINDELESFNQIVSHDLQEPLRKIQMFISRIEESDYKSISETGKSYFEKIRTSASRMQNLMMDLVDYSRAVKDNRVFAESSLKEVAEDVVQELSLNIQEKNATVEIGPLPNANIIKFQIRQLFVNLISNSLKYSKEDVPPEIKIAAEKIKSDEHYNDIALSDKAYYKITVKDNGIGFKQEFSEKMFQLFKRLDTEKEYSGTGLGLAICKKIAENHNGYISAAGDLGKGSVFSIYLPK
ncbi:MAG TPA: ATP-binding protein [Flavobacterium sp.]|nr:ATP-binding protein [Flavobacterium sp.]